MTSNNRLDTMEIRRIFEDGTQEIVELALERRIQAIIDKLLVMRGEIKDPRTCQIVLHLGRQRQESVDVEGEVRKKGY